MEKSFPTFFTCIHCMTYNQSAYITDAMNGFCMQQTNFPFLTIVMDDASTDGEQAVIEDYIKGNFLLSDISCKKWETKEAKWLFAQHRENSNCYFLVVFLKRNMYKQNQAKLELIKEWEDKCKYIALCEGDDYWTDTLKLQKQVDALENHSNCTIAYCKVQSVNKDKTAISDFIIPPEGEFVSGVVTLSDFCKVEWEHCKWCFHTSSFLYRADCHSTSSERDAFFSKFPYGDMPTQLWCLLQGDGYYIDDYGGCYRWLSGGYNSKVSTDKGFRIARERRLVDALFFFDDYTSEKYHREITTKLRHSLASIYLDNYLLLFLPKNWEHVNVIGLKKTIGIILKGFSPTIFSFVYKIVKHHK